jgi:aminopeptidase N
MRTDTPRPVRLEDYRPPAFAVDEVELTFRLEPSATRVGARLHLRRQADGPLFLNGERLKPVSFAIDGAPPAPSAYVLTDDGLTLPSPPDRFVLETEVELDPAANTALEGLYMSGGRFCTQCEAEGFRKITFFPDRPDVLARYTVRIEADGVRYPHLLSNGNLIESGELDGGRRYAVWRDPFPKPSYLFALVAGELDVLDDRFATASGREVSLRIFVDPGQAKRAEYAMDALKRSMRWDEAVYGREYDLDLFMIVAVRDFNFGAMENKGLNIFNSSLLLADPETATDLDYERIEAVVAHEYFHNWTGNRITCRDWFQLCVKEGLTVFRDQGFSADMRDAAVQRIRAVQSLRARQFPEDDGPLAHPPRPSSYLKIDNFYTATVYEKGAEVVRLLKTLVGDADFRRGMDLYFDRHDGQAVTVEAFVSCFAEVSKRDLEGVMLWYTQAGTPRVQARPSWDGAAGTLTVELEQHTPPTPGQPSKTALPIPVRLGLLDEDGRVQPFRVGDGNEAVEETTLVLDGPRTSLRLTGLDRPPVLSALRGFSAPVKLTVEEPAAHRFARLAGDPDLFNRFEAGQAIARELILARAYGEADSAGEQAFAAAMGRALADAAAEPAFKALLLNLPSESDLALARTPADPQALRGAREALRRALVQALRPQLEALHEAMRDDGPFSPDAAGAGRRALRNAALDLLAAAGTGEDLARAEAHFAEAANMTAAIGGLSALVGMEQAEAALAAFHARWRAEPLVLDKWFAVQARSPSADAVGRVLALTAHPDFDPKNPNRLRALVGTFSQANPARFHEPDGSGHTFLADQILATDAVNPALASRLLEPLGGWRRYREELAESMRAQLRRIVERPGLSDNVLELATKALEG